MPRKSGTQTQQIKRQRVPKGQGIQIERKKYQKIEEPIKNITKGDIRRMARRGGIKRISSDVYDLSRLYMKMYISNILKDSMIYANYANRNTVLADDICKASKRLGQTAIGFSEYL